MSNLFDSTAISIRLRRLLSYLSSVNRRLVLAAYNGDIEDLRAAKENGAAMTNVSLDVCLHYANLGSVIDLLRSWKKVTVASTAYQYFCLAIDDDAYDLPKYVHELVESYRLTYTLITGHLPLVEHLWLHVMGIQAKADIDQCYNKWRTRHARRDQHERMLSVAIALRPLKLSVYETLWILEWVQNSALTEFARVRLLESVQRRRV
jgi:hypothetical protein